MNESRYTVVEQDRTGRYEMVSMLNSIDVFVYTYFFKLFLVNLIFFN